MNRPAHLHALFHPRAIAVVGATNKPDNIGRLIFEYLQRSDLPLYPVHPREAHVLGVKAVGTIDQLPPEIDLAVIAVSAAKAVEAAEQCARQGIPQIIVVAGGFSEAGEQGRQLEARLARIPQQYPSRILGPNTLGLFFPANRIDTIFVEHGDQALAGGGGVAFISQSGSVGVEALGLASNTGFGMRAFVGLGNKCDLDELDFLEYFGNDAGTTCLAFYLETLDHGRLFLEQARSIAHRKPIVVLKAGRSEAGASAVSCHTGRLAGSDRVVSGAFRQYGIQRVFDDEELCDAAKALAALPPCPQGRIAVLTPAGGYGVMAADHIALKKNGIILQMARLEQATCRRIRQASFPFAAVNNPVDLTASADDDMFGEVLEVLLADAGVDLVICIAFMGPPGISDQLVTKISRRARGATKPVIVFTQYGPFTNGVLKRFHQDGVVGFPSIERAVRAARFLVERAMIVAALAEAP